jgi:transcriptional regulator with XRE-family HTH domain
MDKENLAKQIGRKITEARDRAELTRADVGKQLGLSERGYGHIEAGRSLITLDHLVQLPRILGVTILDLLPNHITGTAHNSPMLDPVFQDIAACWPDLSDKDKRVLRHHARAFATLRRRERGDEK